MNFKVPYTQYIDITIDDPNIILKELCGHFFNRKDIYIALLFYLFFLQ